MTSVQECQRILVRVGFELPSWEQLAAGVRLVSADEEEGASPKGGWQQKASQELEDEHFRRERLTLTEPQLAVVLSLSGPLSAGTVHQRSHQPRNSVRFRGLHGPLVASPLTSPSSVSTCVPVWPSFLRSWPPPVRMCHDRSSRKAGLCSGKRSGPHMQGGRSPR